MRMPFMTLRPVRSMAVAAALLAFISLAFSLVPIRLQSRFTLTPPISVHDRLSGTHLGPTADRFWTGKLDRPILETSSLFRQYSDRQFGSTISLKPARERQSEPLQFLTDNKEFSFASPSLSKSTTNLWKQHVPDVVLQLEPPVRPRRSIAEMSSAIQSAPRAVLADLHPGAAGIAQRDSFDDAAVKKSLVALAQGLKAGVSFDAPDTPKTLQEMVQQIRAADDIREVMAALTETEINSRAHLIDSLGVGSRLKARFRDTGDITFERKSDWEMALDRQEFLSKVESRLVQGLSKLRAGNQTALGDGVWGKYVRGAHGSVVVKSLKVGADGRALVKLGTEDFAQITAEVPVRNMASRLAELGTNTPEVAALMPRE